MDKINCTILFYLENIPDVCLFLKVPHDMRPYHQVYLNTLSSCSRIDLTEVEYERKADELAAILFSSHDEKDRPKNREFDDDPPFIPKKWIISFDEYVEEIKKGTSTIICGCVL